MSEPAFATPQSRDLALARPILDELAAGFRVPPHRVFVDCDPDLRVSVDRLERLRLVAEEAVDNALRHAFPNHIEGRVWVRLFEDRGRLTLTVRDNGIGMPDFADYAAGGRARIVEQARQLGAFARMGAAPFGGALVSIVCPANA